METNTRFNSVDGSTADVVALYIAEVIASVGPGWFMSKHDISNCFMTLPVKAEQVDTMGFALPGGGYGRLRFCGFGGANFPRINQAVAFATRGILYR